MCSWQNDMRTVFTAQEWQLFLKLMNAKQDTSKRAQQPKQLSLHVFFCLSSASLHGDR